MDESSVDRDGGEEDTVFRQRRLEERKRRDSERWRSRDDIHKEFIIYTFEKNPQRFHLDEINIDTFSVKSIKEEIANKSCRIKIEDMVLMWAGRVFEDTDDLMLLLRNIHKGWYCMGRMTFLLYEQRFIDIVNTYDFDGIKSYFNEIELSQSFINKSYHNRSNIGFSHLEVAAACSNATIMQALCEYGQFVIPMKENICGESLPHFAVSVNNVGVMTLLAAKAYCIESTDDLGRTPLMQACHHGHIEMIAFLIQRGCDVNFRKKGTSITAIRYAMERENLGIAKMLIEAGADVDDVVFHMIGKQLDIRALQGVSSYRHSGARNTI